jgi:hypothetical protein
MYQTRNAHKFWSENLKGRDHSDDLRVDVGQYQKDLKEMDWEDSDWIRLA